MKFLFGATCAEHNPHNINQQMATLALIYQSYPQNDTMKHLQ